MTDIVCREWGKVGVERALHSGREFFTRPQAKALLAAAEGHQLGGGGGRGVLTHYDGYLEAGQVVGVIAVPGCSLEILPKVDADAPAQGDNKQVRTRLVHMLDEAHKLKIGTIGLADMASQNACLLDILIRIFADALLAETRRGLPRLYLPFEDDLPALRGRLDVNMQFTRNAVRPDRLACRYDELSSDIALMQVMKATVILLSRHARLHDTRRKLDELRFVMDDVSDVLPRDLAWHDIHIDRTNRRWQSLLSQARRFLGQEWQATHRDSHRDGGVTLLFAMNELFEAYVAALLRRVLAGNLEVEVIEQGGRQHCLTEQELGRKLFQTKPDIIVKKGTHKYIIDTKWKVLGRDITCKKRGISQADVYQMMAYSQVYDCNRLMLLYPALPGENSGILARFSIENGRSGSQKRAELLIGKIDISCADKPLEMQRAFKDLCERLFGEPADEVARMVAF